jgi:N-methylhydantoinase A/oxoprolinase/acetone carboxylase beta subunit
MELTVTDANVLAGHIPPDLALGGSLALDITAGETVAERLAALAGLDPERLVAGVLEVVDAHMERALRSVSTEVGADPRDSALVAFGGAGGLHASRLAKRLGITTVLIPPHSGVFSALGLIMATPRSDSVRTVMRLAGDPELETVGVALSAEANDRYGEMFGEQGSATHVSADMRYKGQAYELEVPEQGGWGNIEQRFHRIHRERFGFDRPGEPVEVVNVRVTVSGVPPLIWNDLPAISDQLEPQGANGVWRRETLPAGFSVEGPATIVEDNSATRVETGDQLIILEDGTLEISALAE